MKTIARIAIAIVASSSSLFAGDALDGSAAASGYDGQKWFGAPYIQFARKNSDTTLPGYAVGTASYTYRFASDFDILPGDDSSDAFSFWTPVMGFNHENMHLFAWRGYGAHKYDSSVPNLLTDHTMQSLTMPVVFLHDISEKWLWGAVVMPSYAGTDSSSDNFSISLGAGVGYSFSSCLELFAGVYYNDGFGDSLFIPGAAFIWRPAPRWEVYMLPPIGGISYSVNENWLLSLYGQYDSPTWHVQADAMGPDRDINMPSFRLGLKAEYHVHNLLWAYVGAGVSMFQQMDIEGTRFNNTIQKSDIDPSPFVQAGLNIRF
jgi:hypothetical protein